MRKGCGWCCVDPGWLSSTLDSCAGYARKLTNLGFLSVGLLYLLLYNQIQVRNIFMFTELGHLYPIQKEG